VKNALKIVYIFVAGLGVFFVNNIYVLLAIIAVHFLLFLAIKNEQKSFKFLYKVRWFIILIFLFESFIGPNDFDLIKLKKWTLSLSYDGLLNASIMASKLIAMLMITQVVRLTMKGKEFVQGMTKLGLGESSAEIIDQILVILSEEKDAKSTMAQPNKQGSGQGGGQGKGRGGGQGGGQGRGNNFETKEDLTSSMNRVTEEVKEEGEVRSKDVLFRGRIGNIPKRLLDRINFAKGKFANNPNAVIASASLSVTLIRMVKIAPGLPLAPGHKNILFIPVFIHGIMKSEQRWAGTQIGFISGILHFTMGFGKYGPLGILEFMTIGWVYDLLLRLPFEKNRLWYLMLLGGIGGLVRISTEMLIAFVLGVPDAFFLIFLPYVISQIAFGIASGFITKSIINTTD